MKDFLKYITERLAIEDNPNAYTPPPMSGGRSAADIAFERRQKARYGSVMARAAAQALAAAQRKTAGRKPSREPYPWRGATNVSGWWHPKQEWFTFSHGDPDEIGGGNYHVTEIARNPKRFGISTAELNAGLMKEGKTLNAMGGGWYDNDGNKYPFSEPEAVRAEILSGGMDLAYEVQRLAYMKGWLKVYSGSKYQTPTLEGINRDSIRAALREINEKQQSAADNREMPVEVIYVGLTRSTEQNKWVKPSDWSKA